MAVSRFALNRYRYVNDPDEALDMAYDYEHGGFDDLDDYGEDDDE